MHRFRSTASRILFLHIIAIALTAVFMPLVLFWLLNRETASLHQRAMEEQASAVARALSVSSDGRITMELTPALKAEFSEAYGRYFYAVLDPAGKALFSSGPGVTQVFPIEPSVVLPEVREVELANKIIWGVTVPDNVSGRPVLIQVGEDLSHRDALTVQRI